MTIWDSKKTNKMIQDEEGSFRDSMTTVDESGKRKWLFPKKPFGALFNKRKILSYLLLFIMFVTPFLHKIFGFKNPVFLFDVVFRKEFFIFGQQFTTQDSFIFALGLVLFMVAIILFTTIFGRVWCGWLCPQTIFMEMVFRRIEFWIEGDANKQRKLNKQDWNAEKIKKKSLKYFLFLILSWIITHMAVSWIIGVEKMQEMILDNPKENWTFFIVMMALTLIIYGVYMRFREQMCTTFCPYGRLQGVMLGKDSMVVAYDYNRGEPKGKKKDPNAGDCIDCNACVTVCPTGIDIRNGTQMECVNCTACIDACDDIMFKLKREPKLIGFFSEESIETRKKFSFSLRQKAYMVVLVVLMAVIAFITFNRTKIDAVILRNPGSTYTVNGNKIINMYKIDMVNKSGGDVQFLIETDFPEAELQFIGQSSDTLVVAEGKVMNGVMLVNIDSEKLDGMKTMINFQIKGLDGTLFDSSESTFLGPKK